MHRTSKLLALFVLFSAVSINAAVGQNNFTISVGGAFNYSLLENNTIVDGSFTNQSWLGGGYQIDLGHLHLKDSGNLVHGIDTRLSFGQNFTSIQQENGEDISLDDGVKIKFNSTYFSVGSTYQLGMKNANGRLMFDILGVNLGYFTANRINDVTILKATIKTGDSFLLGINLPLGMNYIFNNGLMIGFRHRIDILLGSKPGDSTSSMSGNNITIKPDSGSTFGTGKDQLSYLDYNLTFNIGYAFGK